MNRGPAPVTLRIARQEDIEALAAIAERAPLPGWGSAAIGSEIDRPRALVLIAEVDGTPVGFAASTWVLDEATLLALAVEPSRHRMGVGRLLVEATEQHARSEGVEVMHLEVRASSAGARAFYAAFGYRETGLRRRYYADGEDAVLVSKVLAPA